LVIESFMQLFVEVTVFVYPAVSFYSNIGPNTITETTIKGNDLPQMTKYIRSLFKKVL
jgi:hypothetical protein